MQEIFEKLRSLQDVLSERFRIQKEIDEIPKALATKKELLNRLKKSYASNKDGCKEKEQYIKELRNSAIEAERTREKFEQQMDLIQTQREYEALDKEIKDSGEKEQDLRRELQREEQLLEEMKTNLGKEEMMIEKQEEEVEEEKARIKDSLKEKEKQLKVMCKKEKTITPGLDEEILFKFERIIRSKAGLGIVPIEKSVCNGCHMILTDQFVNNVRGGDGILFCPNCSRILFYPEAETEEIEETEETDD